MRRLHPVSLRVAFIGIHKRRVPGVLAGSLCNNPGSIKSLDYLLRQGALLQVCDILM